MKLFTSAFILHSGNVFDSFYKSKENLSEENDILTLTRCPMALSIGQARWHFLIFKETNGIHFHFKDLMPYLPRILFAGGLNGYLLGYTVCTTREVLFSDSNLSCTQWFTLLVKFFWAFSSWKIFS